MIRLKKCLWKKKECQDLENYTDRGEARKLYQKFKNKSFETGIPTCKNRDGNLVTDTQSVFQIWKEHFRSILVAEISISDEITPIIDDGVDCPPPSQNEISTAISKLKNNKAAEADGLPAELFKPAAMTW